MRLRADHGEINIPGDFEGALWEISGSEQTNY